jgi:hypothetical protein
MIAFDVETIERIVEGSPKSNGRTNLFFPLTEEIGIKASLFEETRDENCETQEKASRFGLGPLVYGKVEFEYLGEKWYGYLTEIVETISFDDFYVENYNDYEEQRKELKLLLEEEIGFNFRDDHPGNLGFKNGNMVCIDFDGPETLNKIHESKVDSILEDVSVSI